MELKEIGDTALMLCGIFSESVNRKITDLVIINLLDKALINN